MYSRGQYYKEDTFTTLCYAEEHTQAKSYELQCDVVFFIQVTTLCQTTVLCNYCSWQKLGIRAKVKRQLRERERSEPVARTNAFRRGAGEPGWASSGS